MAACAVPRPLPSSLLAALNQERRTLATAYGLWALAFLALPLGMPGLNGIHRFYCRKPLSGALWLVTFGLCGIGQLVDLLLIPSLVESANQPLLLREAMAAGEARVLPTLERQLLALARRQGEAGFTMNDALLELQLPSGADSATVAAEIQRLLHADLLDVGNDPRGRVIYREP